MTSIGKKVAKQVAQVAKSVGEAVVKEPLEMVSTAAKQTAGVELPGGGKKQTTKPMVTVPKKPREVSRLANNEAERRKQLEFYRRQLEGLKAETARAAQQ